MRSPRTLPIRSLGLSLGFATALAPQALAHDGQVELRPGPPDESRVEDPTPGTLWLDLDFEGAKVRAAAEGKHVLLYWWQPNPQTERMDALTWTDEEVRAWVREHAVPVKMAYGHPDFDELSAAWRIHRLPSTTLHASDGGFLGQVHSYQPPATFLTHVRAILAGRDADGPLPKPEGEQATDLLAWLGHANQVFQDPERSEEAIAAYFWILDQGVQIDAAFVDAHLDFILQRLMNLARLETEASINIRERMGALRARLLEGRVSDEQALRDLRCIQWLGKGGPYSDLRLWDQLRGQGERQEGYRRLMFPTVLPDLNAYKRYADAAPYAGDTLQKTSAELETFAKERQRILAGGGEIGPGERVTLDSERERITELAAEAFELLLGTGKGADAMQLAERVLEVLPEAQACAALMSRAMRLELYPIVERLGAMGAKVVPDTDVRKAKIGRILERIPQERRSGEEPGR